MNKILLFRLVLALIVPVSVSAQVIGLSLPDTSAVRGYTIAIPVRVDSSLTGANVTSFQLEIQYPTFNLAFDSVGVAGTMTQAAGFTFYANLTEPNIIRIAAAGTTPLSGTGPLVYLRFRIIQSGWSTLTFTDTTHNYFNQHYPPLSLKNGSFYVNDPPSLSLYPDEGVIAVGEQQEFHVPSGTPPYHWSLTNPVVASIDSSGIVTGLAKGFTRIIVHDANGVFDTTSGVFEVRPLRVSVPDTSVYTGHLIDIPVNCSNVTGLNITSGKLTLSFNGDVITPVEIIQTGTLLSSYEPVVVNTGVKGKINIAFAGNVPLAGSGVLFYVRFTATSNGGWTSIAFSNVLFNQDIIAKTVDASLNSQALTSLYLSTYFVQFIVGDTLTFGVNNGTPPYSWSTTDSSIAGIDAAGLLTAKKSGSFTVVAHDALGAVGMTQVLHVFDMLVDIGQFHVRQGGTVDVPLFVRRIRPGTVVSALHSIVAFDTSIIRATGIIAGGTLTDGWGYSQNISGNTINFASASAVGFTSVGTFVKIRFQASQTVPVNSESAVQFQELVFNERTPTALTYDGGVKIVAAPLPPNLLSPWNGATGQSDHVTFTWNASSDAETYRLQVSPDPAFSSLVVDDSNIVVTSWQAGPLSAATTYYWRVRAINVGGASDWSAPWQFTISTAGAEEQTGNVPVRFALEQNYPNPFNPSTVIRFSIPTRSNVTLGIYDLLGHKIAELMTGCVEAGFYQKEWHASAPTGLYLCRIEAVSVDNPEKRFMDVKKMILLK
jgi:hypothetical protein